VRLRLRSQLPLPSPAVAEEADGTNSEQHDAGWFGDDCLSGDMHVVDPPRIRVPYGRIQGENQSKRAGIVVEVK